MADSSHIEITSISPFTAGQETLYEEQDLVWNNETVTELIRIIEQFWEQFYDKSVKKKVLWKKIADHMRAKNFNCSGDDCDKKWRNLKKSYIAILRKQTQSMEFSTKFPYFYQIHNFFGNEIDPLAMREQLLKKKKREKCVTQGERPIPLIPYYEITVDGDFEWDNSAVSLLTRIILDHKDEFVKSKECENIWESISSAMYDNGLEVTTEQCQRKWNNMSEGFRHYQAEAEDSGVKPEWSHFEDAKNVITQMNVPVALGPEEMVGVSTSLKGSIRAPSSSRYFVKPLPMPSPKKRKRGNTRPFVFEEADHWAEDLRQNPGLRSSLFNLEKSLKIDDPLKRVEEKLLVMEEQKSLCAQTNELLLEMLGDLKRINSSLAKRNLTTSLASTSHHVEDMMPGGEVFVGETPIVDEETYQQSLFNISHCLGKFMKQEQEDDMEVQNEPPEGIIYVQGS